MTIQHWISRGTLALVLAWACHQQDAAANGGPFVIKYPEGDPAAKGVLARIDPDLKPGREERLRVLKEDLKILFLEDPATVRRASAAPPRTTTPSPNSGLKSNLRSAITPSEPPPLAVVSAIYTIENPTDQAIEVEFGFPILRGIYLNPHSMGPSPDAHVLLDTEWVTPDLISNSAIYGLIRQRAGDTLENAIAADPHLAKLLARVRATSYIRQRAREVIRQLAQGEESLSLAIQADPHLAKLASVKSDADDPDRAKARQDLLYYLTGPRKWEIGPATLLIEYASLQCNLRPEGRAARTSRTARLASPFPLPDTWNGMTYVNLGRLDAIGEQKATQLFATLAAQFDPSVRTAYENVFSAWGGDVRERSVDLATGKVRARELTLPPKNAATAVPWDAALADPTLYARTDYINPNAVLTPAEKASCEAILKNLPVTFTFAPMNLLHYKAKFPAKTTRTLAVHYKQYAYSDTATPPSYQLAYVLHPASLWKEFGPIQLEVAVPAPADPGDQPLVTGSVPLTAAGLEERDLSSIMPGFSAEPAKRRVALYRGNVQDKTGELFLGISTENWKQCTGAKPGVASN